jgi:hypothetical protein
MELRGRLQYPSEVGRQSHIANPNIIMSDKLNNFICSHA